MNTRKITTTIGIPAYNEEKNIGHLLASLRSQKEKTINIHRIIVVSDGSTDNTVSIVRSFRHPTLELMEGRTRLGKPSRLNQLFQLCRSDTLVIVDADMLCKDPYTIENLVSKFRTEENVGLVTGNPQPLPARTFIEAAVNNYFDARNSVMDKFDFGKTGYSIHGFLAYSKLFLQNFQIPNQVLLDDAFSYFACITSRFKHVFAPDAVIYHRSPGSPLDYVRQMIRWISGGPQLYQYFDRKIVDEAPKLPLPINLLIVAHQLKYNPLGYVTLKLLTVASSLYCKINKNPCTVKYDIIHTSKSLMSDTVA